jgi:hypothetical protein
MPATVTLQVAAQLGCRKEAIGTHGSSIQDNTPTTKNRPPVRLAQLSHALPPTEVGSSIFREKIYFVLEYDGGEVLKPNNFQNS